MPLQAEVIRKSIVPSPSTSPIADRVEAERVARHAAGVGLHQTAVLAGVEIGAAPGNRRARVLPRADDQVGVPVAVDVAGRRRDRCRSPRPPSRR